MFYNCKLAFYLCLKPICGTSSRHGVLCCGPHSGNLTAVLERCSPFKLSQRPPAGRLLSLPSGLWAASHPGQVWQHCWLPETSLLAEHLTSSFFVSSVCACSSQCKYCPCLHWWDSGVALGHGCNLSAPLVPRLMTFHVLGCIRRAIGRGFLKGVL